jgi:hypothetical protein
MLRCLALLNWVFLTCSLQAHDPGLSTATVDLGADRIAIHLGFAISDLASLGISPEDQPALEALATRAVSWISAEGAEPLKVISIRKADANSVEFLIAAPDVPGEFHSLLLAELPLGHRQLLTLRDYRGQTQRTKLLSAKADRERVQAEDLRLTAQVSHP